MNSIKKTEDYLKIDNKPKYFIFVCLLYLLIPIAYLLYRRKNNWLICERGNDAQDNGFFFYKYVRENHPEINIVYLIKKNCKGYEKVFKLGKVVEYGSLKHFLMMIAYPVKISSHLFGYSGWKNYTTYLRRHKTRDKHIFLQHGIIKNDHPGLYGPVTHLDLFVCGAKPEYEYIRDTFQYQNNEVQYTGLPRYDDLNDFECKSQILFMPTWRRELMGVSDEEFVKSDFYKNWNDLLNSSKLIDICSEKGLIIKFYLHYSLQKYSHLFKSNDVVKIINFSDEEVHDLLKDSNMLVTDFSSVYFDMAYMNKPIVYFQFDEETFNDEHYGKGYFDYRVNGFGPVINNSEDIEKNIVYLVNNYFTIDKDYVYRFENVFLYHGKNCERIFYSILNLIRKCYE